MAKRTPKKKPSTETPPASNGHAELLRQLWEAAVKLRGSIEAPDYKRYVLPIIFLRFLSIRYERRRAELIRLVEDPQSDYYQLPQVLDDPDEYRAAGSFVVPEPARWSKILEQATADDIKVKLDDALELLETTYPDRLRGLLPRIYAGSNLSRESVTGLINLFSKDVFRQDHGGEDLIGRVYEYFIGEFANTEGKRGGEYFTPVSIVNTLVAMLEPTEGTVFDPCPDGFGVQMDGRALTVHASADNFGLRKHNLVQAMLAVPMVASLFYEDVVAWLDLHDARYTPKGKFTGKTGYDHLFDFVIPKSRQQPERIVQTINRPSRDTAQAAVLAWIDTKEVRSSDSRAYALLNDSEQPVSMAVLDALRSYDVRPVSWSQRDSLQHELAA